MANPLKCKIVSAGTWGAHFANFDVLSQLMRGECEAGEPQSGPKPVIIPANERRRAPLTVRLAVESSWQACEHSQLAPTELTSVFVSGYGDTDLTDYMCRVLASDNKQLSPTKFHNSVHNAPAGYWTISTGATLAANSVAGFHNSVTNALLEAMIQCQVEQTPVLVTFYDAPVASTMRSILTNDQAFAGSIIICPESSPLTGLLVSAVVEEQASEWPALASDNPMLQSLYHSNPSAKLLCIFEKMAAKVTGATLDLPLSEATSLKLEFS